MTVSIPLRDRSGTVVAETVVDQTDAERVEARGRWHRLKNGYAARTERADGRKRMLYLHRFLLGLDFGDPRQGDHENRNRLDNRRSNLRIVTPLLNGQNVPAQSGTSRHRGVSWHRGARKWMAKVDIEGRQHYLGLFRDEAEAAHVAATFRLTHMPGSLQ